MNLKGKVAVISGGASGLGLAAARRFISQGARCAILDINEDKGNALISALGDSAMFFKVDVTDENSVAAAISETISAFGAVHINGNFAGIGSAMRTINKDGAFPIDRFQKVIEVNLVGTFNVLRLCAEKMGNNKLLDSDGSRGVIINTASAAAYEGQIGQVAYSASKAGIVGMTLPLARDLAVMGIRVNTIVPGLIATPLMMGGGAELTPEIEASLKPLTGQVLFPSRLGRADEVAHVAQMLVENNYMNGECVRIDGGIRMQPR